MFSTFKKSFQMFSTFGKKFVNFWKKVCQLLKKCRHPNVLALMLLATATSRHKLLSAVSISRAVLCYLFFYLQPPDHIHLLPPPAVIKWKIRLPLIKTVKIFPMCTENIRFQREDLEGSEVLKGAFLKVESFARVGVRRVLWGDALQGTQVIILLNWVDVDRLTRGGLGGNSKWGEPSACRSRETS